MAGAGERDSASTRTAGSTSITLASATPRSSDSHQAEVAEACGMSLTASTAKPAIAVTPEAATAVPVRE